MSKNKTKISFIIPVYNEEECIDNVLDAIHHNSPKGYSYEIIVIDNGSTDNTVKICKEQKATIIVDSVSTIAGLRNNGAAQSNGDILVFIDADILLTNQWQENIVDTINLLIETPLIITGSRTLPTEEKHWLNIHWFQRMTEYDAPYMNTGHLITSRILFEAIQGFNSELETAEDYDFSMRAKAQGAQVINNKKLPVIHLGNPNTIKEFFNRERWHGKQDFQSWQEFKDSKIAWIAAFNLLLGVFSLLTSVYFNQIAFLLPYPIGMFLTSLLLTLYKYPLMNPYASINTAGVFYVYITGRTMSLLDSFFKKPQKK